MSRRFEPSEQQQDHLSSRRLDALNRHFGPYFREFLVPPNAKHLDRFRAEPRGSCRDELRDEPFHDESED